jgi:hypothetical protein
MTSDSADIPKIIYFTKAAKGVLKMNPEPQVIRPKEKWLKRITPVTVCVAAIAEKSVVIGISDRMLTAGDIQFEPGQAKMWNFTSSIWALVAGDMAIQAELMKRVNIETQRRMVADPKPWLLVKDVADTYCREFRKLRRDRAEAEILSPLGLDFDSFVRKQSAMHADIISAVTNKLAEYDFPELLEAIFIGTDTDGPVAYPTGELRVFPQIYVTEGDKLSWLSSVGFAAIGSGKSHAESQFMVSGHWALKPLHETLLLAMAAKKRAEVAPGVGRDTDMVVIGPGLGTAYKVEDKHLQELEDMYRTIEATNERAVRKEQKRAEQFVKKVRLENERKQRKEKGVGDLSQSAGEEEKSKEGPTQ